MSTNIQEVIPNIVITEKDDKICQNRDTRDPQRSTQGTFSDEVTPDIDGFTNEPVVQCDVQVAGKYFFK